MQLLHDYPFHFLGALLFSAVYGYILFFETTATPQETFDGKPLQVDLSVCKDRYEFCERIAKKGKCAATPGWMILNCPVACGSCHLRDPNVRCRREFLNISSTPIYLDGEMDNLFESLQSRWGAESFGKIEVLSRDPLVATIENFVTDEEAHTIISLQKEFSKSMEYGSVNEFGETGHLFSSRRTSKNSWCDEECIKHRDTQSVLSRIEQVLNIPRTLCSYHRAP